MWNIGVILYILLVGKYPIMGNCDDEIIKTILSLGAEWSPSYRADLTKNSRDFLSKFFEIYYLERADKTKYLNDNFIL